jgi:hypothetical protein
VWLKLIWTSNRSELGKRLVAAVGKGSIDTIKELMPVIIQQALAQIG